MARESKRARLDRLIREQQRWLAEHGTTLYGYVQRYGSVHDPEHYGDGGEAIYHADHNALLALEAERDALRKKSPAKV